MTSLISLIILARDINAKIVSKLIKLARGIREIKEVIIIAQGDGREIHKVAKKFGVEIIYQSIPGLPRRGVSMRDGFYYSSGEVVMFIDADSGIANKDVITEIYSPTLSGEADLVRVVASAEKIDLFNELVRSLLIKLYPELTRFSGYITYSQIGLRKIYEGVEWDLGWGVEIGILIDAMKRSTRIIEIDLSSKLREVKPLKISGDVVQEIIETVIRRGVRDGKIKESDARELLSRYQLMIKENMS